MCTKPDRNFLTCQDVYHLLGSCLHETKINLNADLRWKTKEKYWRWFSLIYADWLFFLTLIYADWLWFVRYSLLNTRPDRNFVTCQDVYQTWQELRNLSGCVPSPWFVSSRNKNKLKRWLTLKKQKKNIDADLRWLVMIYFSSPWFVSSRNKNKIWRWFTLKNKRKILTLIYADWLWFVRY